MILLCPNKRAHKPSSIIIIISNMSRDDNIIIESAARFSESSGHTVQKLVSISAFTVFMSSNNILLLYNIV